MTEQRDLFESEPKEPYHGFPPFEKASDTSAQAATDIEPNVNTLRAKVLGTIRRTGNYGATDAEIEMFLEMSHQTVSARRRELHLKGLIGTESKRKNPSGSMANVWKSANLCHDPEATKAKVEMKRCRHCGRLT